jgi:hypothetical protein
LQRGKEAAFPNLKDRSIIDESLCPADWQGNYTDLAHGADIWAENILQKVEEHGINNVIPAQDYLWRVNAAKRGDDSELEPIPFNRRWKMRDRSLIVKILDCCLNSRFNSISRAEVWY